MNPLRRVLTGVVYVTMEEGESGKRKRDNYQVRNEGTSEQHLITLTQPLTAVSI